MRTAATLYDLDFDISENNIALDFPELVNELRKKLINGIKTIDQFS